MKAELRHRRKKWCCVFKFVNSSFQKTGMEFTAKQISELLKGTVEGNEQVRVNKLCKIEEGEAGSLSFLANPKYMPFIYNTQASLVIVNNDFVPEQPVSATLIRVENAYNSFVQLLEIYNRIQLDKKGIEQPSFISDSAKLGKDCYVGAFAYVGNNVTVGNNVRIYPQVFIGDNVTIGDSTTLFAGARVYSDCKIGSHCTLHTGTVIGADGFGFTPNSENEYKKVAQIGNVINEDHVEIGANTCIDRGTIGPTLIGAGTKIDNLCQIAHNVQIGKDCLIIAQTGIAGSALLGDRVTMAGSSGCGDGVKIGNDVVVAAFSAVNSDVDPFVPVMGAPAIAYGEFLKRQRALVRLPRLQEELRKLKSKVEELCKEKI